MEYQYQHQTSKSASQSRAHMIERNSVIHFSTELTGRDFSVNQMKMKEKHQNHILQFQLQLTAYMDFFSPFLL